MRPAGLCYSAVWRLVALLLLFFARPFVEVLPRGNLIDAVLLTLAIVSAVLAAGRCEFTYSGVVPVNAPLLFTANDCLDFWHRPRLAGWA